MLVQNKSKTKKVIFLDFDGVINDYLTMDSINEKNVAILKQIIDETGAKVVVTSSCKYGFQWAGIKDWKNTKFYLHYGCILKKLGVEIYDVTPWIQSNRNLEIESYLMNNSDIEEFLILDDDRIIEKYKEHEIYLDLQSGLREEHIKPALDILNGKLHFYHDYPELNETLEERVSRMNKIYEEKRNSHNMIKALRK